MMGVEWALQFFAVLGLFLPVAAVFSFVHRRVAAAAHARSGPNRLGPRGALQGVGDILKLLQKTPRLEMGFWVGSSALTFGTIAFLPLGSQGLKVDSELSVFWTVAFVLAMSFWEGLMGSRRRQFARWLAGLRGLAQGLSAMFPAFLALVAQGAIVGGFSIQHWVERQGASPLGWACVEHPLGAVNFLVFWWSGILAWGWSPFETFRGLWARQGGINYAMVAWVRFYGMVSWLVFTAAFFLGGWKAGLEGGTLMLEAVELLVVLLKVLALYLAMVFVQSFSLRLRADQATTFSWEVLVPASLVGVVGSLLWVLGRG